MPSVVARLICGGRRLADSSLLILLSVGIEVRDVDLFLFEGGLGDGDFNGECMTVPPLALLSLALKGDDCCIDIVTFSTPESSIVSLSLVVVTEVAGTLDISSSCTCKCALLSILTLSVVSFLVDNS